MEASFIKEGKPLEFDELVQVVGQMISEKVLKHCEQQEVERFFMRLFKATCEDLKAYMESKNYRIITEQQGFLTAQKLKLVSDITVWEKAIKLNEQFQKEHVTAKADEVVEYIESEYYPEMKKVKKAMEATQKN